MAKPSKKTLERFAYMLWWTILDSKLMSLYDATQEQRYIERQVRRWKREDNALDAAGLDNSAARNKVRE